MESLVIIHLKYAAEERKEMEGIDAYHNK